MSHEHASTDYYCDIFSFLSVAIPTNGQGTSLNITCFDVTRDKFACGSNIGTIYGFNRGTEINSEPHWVAQLSDKSLNSVSMIGDDLIVATTNNEILVFGLSSKTVLQTIRTSCLQITVTVAFFTNPQTINILLGDSTGRVIKYIFDVNLLNYKNQILFEEDIERTFTHSIHPIVDICPISDDEYCISSCFRSVVLTVQDKKFVQIGQNRRKSCGNFGAIEVDGSIFACRPSSHLVIADKKSGLAKETFILKKSVRPPPQRAFQDLKKLTSLSTDSSSSRLQLGRLIRITSDLLCSWTTSSIVIVSVTGVVLLEESHLYDIIAVSCVHNSVDTFELFILFEDKTIVRLRNFFIPDKHLTFQNTLRKTVESLPHPFSHSLLTILFNQEKDLEDSHPLFLDNEKANDREEKKDPFGFVRPTDMDEVIVSRKRHLSKGTKKSISKSRSASSSSLRGLTFNTSKTSIFSLHDSPPSFTIDAEGSSQDDKNITLAEENERLMKVLQTYKIQSPEAEVLCEDAGMHVNQESVESQEQKGESSSTTEISEKIPDVITDKKPIINDPREDQLTQTNQEENCGDRTNFFSLNYQTIFSTDLNCNKKTENEETIRHEINWNPVISSNSKEKLPFSLQNVTSITSFNDESLDGIALLVNDADSYIIFIYPGFKRIKCPKSKTPVKDFEVNSQEIIILYEDGSIWLYSAWMKSRFFGKRFSPVLMTRTRIITSISVNKIDQLAWLSDEEGLGWIYKLRSNNCLVARDDTYPPTRLTSVSVSPRNSAIVWAIDQNSKLFVREGIFNDKSDGDTLIAGINWVPVTDMPYPVKCVKASHDSVWIVSHDTDKSGEERLFKRTGVDPPLDYIGNGWEEYRLPSSTSSIMSISAAPTGDLWLLTNERTVYQYCLHEKNLLKQVEDGWMLV